MSKKAVHFGAGNIGRGFIGPLLSQSGYHVVFVDVQDTLIDALNSRDSYTVEILDHESKEETIRNASGLRTNDPAVVDAIAVADIVTTSVGANVLPKVAPVIAEGLAKRTARPEPSELTVIACENMLGGTSQLRDHVLKALEEKGLEADLSLVGFADCAVDRIVPPFEGDDPLAVGVEGFYEWVVEEGNIKGNVDVKGMQRVSRLQPFLERKLYTLNCGHAILAYIGTVKGLDTVLDAISDEYTSRIVRGALEESGAALVRRHSDFFTEEKHREYIDRTMTRYANPKLHDVLTRVGRTPLRKLSEGERLMGAVQMCKEQQVPTTNLLLGVAAAFYFDVKDDEESQELMKLVRQKGIEKAVQEITGLEDADLREVVKNYHNLGKWKGHAHFQEVHIQEPLPPHIRDHHHHFQENSHL